MASDNPRLPWMMHLETSFEQTYRCYLPSFLGRPHIESGDKIIMPPSALDRLVSLNIEYPMLFELRNTDAGRASHCGVLEFIAEEGMIGMPCWMMENLRLQEGDYVHVRTASLPKGTYVKLQPHTKDFLDISNPKAILETTLRSYSCFTTGDTVMVTYNGNKYYMNIVETKPSGAVSIIETDCEVDFAPPVDYKEPERPSKGKLVFGSDAVRNTRNENRKDVPEEPKEEPESKKFQAFSGKSYSLRG